MSNVQKLMAAVIAVFAAGFLLVAENKQQSPEELEAQSMIRNVANMQEMANQKCPKAIEEITGDKLFFPSDTKTDKSTYVTMTWTGEEGDHFKTAECTLHVTIGGISKLVIDGQVYTEKKI